MKEKISKLQGLHEYLSANIIGQDHVLKPWCEIVSRGFLNITNTNRPRGNFLLLGPTGTGKTELVNLTIRYLYGNNENLCRIDMSEYGKLAGNNSLQKLIGSPGGDIGALGKFLEEHTEGIILYDEFEKAHPELFTILLQQLDAARVTLANHKTYDLSKFFIVCTSNVAADVFQKSARITLKRLAEVALNTLRKRFSPEFIARFGQLEENILTFKKLQIQDLRTIAHIFLKKEISRLGEEHNLKIHDVDPQFIERALRKCDSTKNGAREIRSVIESMIQNACVINLLDNKALHGRLTLNNNLQPYLQAV